MATHVEIFINESSGRKSLSEYPSRVHRKIVHNARPSFVLATGNSRKATVLLSCSQFPLISRVTCKVRLIFEFETNTVSTTLRRLFEGKNLIKHAILYKSEVKIVDLNIS